MARLRSGVGGTLVLDAQGLVRLAAGDPAVRARVRAARQRDGDIVTAASTLAEVLRGGPEDAPVHQALQHVTVVPIGKDLGRRAGELLGAADGPGHPRTADSLLAAVALAQQRPVVLLTSDPAGLGRLTGEPHRKKTDQVAVITV